MRPKKPKLYEYEEETPELTIGSFNSFTEVPKGEKPKKKDRIGFIRDKSDDNSRSMDRLDKLEPVAKSRRHRGVRSRGRKSD